MAAGSQLAGCLGFAGVGDHRGEFVNPPYEVSALVLSGGGAYAAYEVGVMKALIAGVSPATGLTPLDPAIFSGSSAGSVNAAFMASQPAATLSSTVQYLEDLWVDQIAEDSASCYGAVRYR